MKQRFQLVALLGGVLSVVAARAQTVVTWANLGTDFATGANWTGGAPANDTTTNIVSFNSTTPTVQPVVATAYSVAGVQFASGAGQFTLSGAGSLTIGSSGIDNQTTTGLQSISVALVFASAGTSISNSASLQLSGSITNNTPVGLTLKGAGFSGMITGQISGSGALIKDGTGTWTIAGAGNALANATFVNQGTLIVANTAGSATGTGNIVIGSSGTMQVGSSSAAGSVSGAVTNNGYLVFSRTDATTFANGIAGNGTVRVSASGSVTLGGTNSYSGNTELNGSGSLSDAAANAFSSASAIIVTSGNATLNVNYNETIAGLGGVSASSGSTTNLGSGATLTINNPAHTYLGTIAGNGSLAITGKGSETLGGANTYTGGTSITGALLIATNTSGSATGTGTVTISGGTLQLGATGAGGAVSGNIVDNGNVFFASTDSSTYAGVISGSGSLNVGMFNSTSYIPGTLTLTGANSYGGTTTVGSGTLRVGAVNTLPTTTSVSIGSSGVLDVANDQTIGRLLGAPTTASIVLGAGKTLTLAPSSNSFNGRFDGTISGSGSVNFAGASGGSMTLGGNNTFSGGATIGSGTVFVTNGQSLGTGTVTVQSNAALLVNPGAANDVTLSNAVSLGGNATIGSNHNQANLTLAGNITVPTGNATVHVSDFVLISGPLSAASGSTALTFDSVAGGFGNVVFLAAPSATITTLTASKAGIIFGSNSAVPTSGLSLQAATGYVGIAAVPGLTPPSAASVLSLIPDRAGFAGTLGFDTGADNVAPYNFTDAIDLTGFGAGFTLGSVTQAVLSGPITPAASGYAFGNGGGVLIVNSALTGNYDVTVASTTQIPKNTFTLALRGNNTFTGNVTVTNSLLVLDSASALPAGKKVALNADGYVGYTEAFAGTATFADFVTNHLGSYTPTSVIGLDSHDFISTAISTPNAYGQRVFSDPLDLSALNPVYLGTTTSLILTGTIIAPNQGGANKTLSLLAADDSVLVVSSALLSNNVTQLVVGSPTAAYGKGAVMLLNANTYGGGTQLVSGKLVIDGKNKVVGNAIVAGPLGSGTLTVPGNAQKPALIAGGGNASINNPIALGSTLQLGVSSLSTLSSGNASWDSAFASRFLALNGVISDLDASHLGSLNILGPVALNGASTFSGGVTLQSGSDVTIGSASAFGAGTVTINTYDALVRLTNNAGSITLNNPIVFNGNQNNPVQLSSADPLTFGGSVTLNNSMLLSNSSYSSYSGPGAVTITGQISGVGRLTWAGYANLVLNPSTANTFGGGIEATSGAVILANANALPTSPYNNVLTASGTGYIGIAFVPGTDLQSTFIDRFNKGATTGSIGFDSPSLTAPNTFNTPIDLRSFSITTNPSLGSATSAILGSSAIITPTLDTYKFGGGGGLLEVKSALVDATGFGPTPRNVSIGSGAGGPLTVRLTGANSYTGSTTVSGGALVFGANALPASTTIQAYSGAYVGTEDTTFAANPNSFISRLSSGTFRAIVGFDSFTSGSPFVVSGPISLSNFTSTSDPQIYLGTTTTATISGAITLPSTQTAYRFAGYKGGQLTVASQLTSGSVVIGDSSSLATGGVNGFGGDMLSVAGLSGVTLTGSNSYSGGTVLNAGVLYIGNDNALGSGTLSINSDSSAPYRGLLAAGAARSVSNPIEAYGSLAIGGDYNLTLSGNISGDGALAKVGAGTLTLSGNNSTYSGFVEVANGGLVYQGDNSIGSSVSLMINSGASVTFGGNAAIDGLYGNYDGTGGAVNLTAGKTLLIHQYSDSQFGGTFAGTTAGLSFDSQYPTTSGWLKLTGASTYTGPTNILSGGAILAANGNAFGASTNPVTLNGGKLGVATGVTVSNPITLTSGKIVGLGTYQAPAGGGFDIKSGIVLSPGFGLGGKLTFDGSLLSTSTLILNGGGTYDWHIVDFANATTGYDSVAVNGTVSIAATTSTPFTVNIISVAPTGGQGLASNFDPTHPYSWNILTATNITGYTSPSQFALGLNFTNPNSGLFSLGLDTSHTNLVLTFNPVPEPSTYALLLAGLGLTWFATRRRRCYPR